MIAAEVAKDYTGPMRPFIVGSVAALFLTASCWLGAVWAEPPSLGGRPKSKTATSSEVSPKSRRYPALAYASAGLITLIVVTIVAFPSRKEAWDQGVEKKTRRAGKRIRGE
jgi:hypothetical protein